MFGGKQNPFSRMLNPHEVREIRKLHLHEAVLFNSLCDEDSATFGKSSDIIKAKHQKN